MREYSCDVTCVRSRLYRDIPIYEYFNGALKSHEEEH